MLPPYAPLLHVLALRTLDRAIDEHIRPGRIAGTTEEALSVVALVGMSLEAGVNEIASHVDYRDRFPASFDDNSLEEKWHQVTKIIATVDARPGEAPWQDLRTFISLRNAVVHIKADGNVRGAWKTLLRKQLASRITIDDEEHQLSSCLNLPTCQWAVNVSASVFCHVSTVVGRDNDPSWRWGSRKFHFHERPLPPGCEPSTSTTKIVRARVG